MRLGGGDVLGIHMAIDVDGDVDFLHDRVGALGEPPAPHLVAHDLTRRLIVTSLLLAKKGLFARNAGRLAPVTFCIAISDPGRQTICPKTPRASPPPCAGCRSRSARSWPAP